MSPRRLLAGGVLLALLAGVGGTAIELWRFGRNETATAARLEQQVRRDFDRMTGILAGVASGIASDPLAARALEAGPDAARDLFDLIDRRLASAGTPADDIAVTVYNVGGCGTNSPDRCAARAWAGRPSDVRVPGRLTGPPSFFVTQSPLGLRLVHVQPIFTANQSRVGAVAAEYARPHRRPRHDRKRLGAANVARSGHAAHAMGRGGDDPRAHAFLLHAPDGVPLVEVSMTPAEFNAVRRAWRRRVGATMVAVAAVTLLLLIGPALDRRAAATTARQFLRATATALGWLAGASLVCGLALALELGRRPPPGALLLLGGVTTAAAIALLAGPVLRLRVGLRATRREPGLTPVAFYGRQVLAGAVMALVLFVFERLLPRAVDPATVDLRHFSLHPWSVVRLALLTGILACHAAALWTCTLVLTAALAHWRVSAATTGPRLRVALLWLAPSLAVAALAWAGLWALPALGLVLAAAACTIAALSARRLGVWYRHATVAARILALFVAFLLPALLLYPSMDYFAEAALRSLIASQYAVEAQRHSQTLQEGVSEARQEIDQLDLLPLVTSDPGAQLPMGPQNAYFVWSRTVLARARFTSAVELYNADDVLVSRFALYLPEYRARLSRPRSKRRRSASGACSARRPPLAPRNAACCTRPVRSARRGPRVFRRDRSARSWSTCCSTTARRPSSRRRSVLRASFVRRGDAPREGTTGSEADVAIYGWARRALYSSPHATWSIDDTLFRRIYDP